jgi:hypothetical protein
VKLYLKKPYCMSKPHRILFISLVLFVVSLAANAQEIKPARRLPMIGFNIVGNIPGAPFGFSIPYFFKDGKYGIYADVKAKFDGNNPSGTDYTSTLTKEEIERDFPSHMYLGERTSGTVVFNVGFMVRPHARPLYFYGGLGAKTVDTYRQYYTPAQILDATGYYYIQDRTSYVLNMTAGAMYVFNSGLTLQGGFDTHPLGLNLGIGFILMRYK